jgi:nucleotide-binding universal stress UspA family protein
MPSEYFSQTAAQYVRTARERSAAALKDLAGRLGREGAEAVGRIVTGEASSEIVAESRRGRADLITMASHGRSGARDWPFGSVTERVLRTSPTPVLMFREGQFWGPMVRRILVALDGSEESLESVPPVMDVASALRAEVLLVHAGRRLPAAVPVAQKMLAERHLPFETRLLSGEPVDAILSAVGREHVDIAALTTTGESSSGDGRFGVVAAEVLKRCERPLLVVHTGRVS